MPECTRQPKSCTPGADVPVSAGKRSAPRSASSCSALLQHSRCSCGVRLPQPRRWVSARIRAAGRTALQECPVWALHVRFTHAAAALLAQLRELAIREPEASMWIGRYEVVTQGQARSKSSFAVPLIFSFPILSSEYTANELWAQCKASPRRLAIKEIMGSDRGCDEEHELERETVGASHCCWLPIENMNIQSVYTSFNSRRCPD